MYLTIAILAAVTSTALLLWSPGLQTSKSWRAMTTPLASIIGSGFLVLGPILDSAYGKYAPVVMAGLCIGAYLYGSAIRYNIACMDAPVRPDGWLVNATEKAASWSLSFAYVISVAYYLNLFGSFGVSLTPVNDPLHAKLLTSAIFVVILVVGWTRGFKLLEHMEYVSVTAKLAIITGLLVGLATYFYTKAIAGQLVGAAPQQTGWSAITLAFGLIVTVQGFETSRYLGAEYNSQTRIQSMKWAQWISSAIYMIYILLLAYVFEPGQLKISETAIVELMAIVAPILPALLVAAALAAQFSAAVADTSGSGGLIVELTNARASARMGYALLTAIGLTLTWTANVFEIITYASRAFAFYYMLQSGIAAARAWGRPNQSGQCALFIFLAILGLLIVVFGTPIEG